MRSSVTRRFREQLSRLPNQVQQQAHEAYRRWLADPNHPGVQFKRVGQEEPIYSARVGRGYRAVGILEEDRVDWFWIGSHAEYDHLLGNL